ncbi:MAG: aminoacetone oxidase family FAD-binding enzyme, partial [Paracoccaceae bacterium]
MPHYQTVILGAGAAGMMCAAQAGAHGGRVLVIDHAKAPGEKIRISGGGRCNFTNLHSAPENFLSANPHFCKSALARYSQWDFIDLVARHGIPWHEKTLGQLFCDNSAKDIIALLLEEMAEVGAELRLQTAATAIDRTESGFAVTLSSGAALTCDTLVVATGGKSIPKMGASSAGYRIAEQFSHAVTETRPGLVPLTFGDEAGFKPLAGVACPARVSCNGAHFDEALLFTHRGLSGPAILQISSYWREGDPLAVNLLPGADPFQTLRARKAQAGRKALGT